MTAHKPHTSTNSDGLQHKIQIFSEYKQHDWKIKKLRIGMLGHSLAQNGGISTVENLILKYAAKEVEIQHIATFDDGSIAYKCAVFGTGIRKFAWKLLCRKIELVHIHVSERGSVLRNVILTLIAFIFRKPVLIHAHGAEFHLFFSTLPKWLQQGLSFIFRRCTAFIVLSKAWKEYYIRTLGLKAEQVFVLPNSVELPSQVPHRINANRVSMVFFGRIGQRKGTFDLIRAFASLPSEQKDRCQLIVAGDGDVEQGRKLVESLNVADYVTFLGWVSPEQRNQLLAKADVFVLPSYNEGLPLALLEAMAWGLPAITTPVGGIPELVTSSKDALLVTPGDIQQLSEAMQSLIADESLRLSLGTAARKTVAPFDVKNYSGCLADIYRSVLTLYA